MEILIYRMISQVYPQGNGNLTGKRYFTDKLIETVIQEYWKVKNFEHWTLKIWKHVIGLNMGY